MKAAVLWLLISVNDYGAVHVVSYHESRMACQTTRDQITAIKRTIYSPIAVECVRSHLIVPEYQSEREK